MSAISVASGRPGQDVSPGSLRPAGEPYLVISVEGELDMTSLREFRSMLSYALSAGSPVVVDLRRARFLSLRNAVALAESAEAAAVRGVDFRVLASRREIERVLAATGIETSSGVRAR